MRPDIRAAFAAGRARTDESRTCTAAARSNGLVAELFKNLQLQAQPSRVRHCFPTAGPTARRRAAGRETIVRREDGKGLPRLVEGVFSFRAQFERGNRVFPPAEGYGC